ncbi:MAG: hypothetical protein AABY85_06045 [Gemmatimonadota bacterium]
MTVEEPKPISVWSMRGVALCAEAQADGVPCTELGRDCETCARAIRDFSPDDLAIIRETILRRGRQP